MASIFWFGSAAIVVLFSFFSPIDASTPGGSYSLITRAILFLLFCGCGVWDRAYNETESRSDESSAYDKRAVESSCTKGSQSRWEAEIAGHVRRKTEYDKVGRRREIKTNDRTVVVASDGNTPLEIDIYIPELKLGIEANGEYWHDHSMYEQDQKDGTTYSEEMYKERYCAKKGIRLIHVWDSDSLSDIYDKIDRAIAEQERLYG